MSETLELEAGRELDALIAERVMGWRVEDFTYCARWRSPVANSDGTHTEAQIGSGRTRAQAEATCAREDRTFPGIRPVVDNVPEYSTDIAAAWDVVEVMVARGWAYAITRNPHAPQHGVKFYRGVLCLGRSLFAADQHEGYHAVEPTAPLAICRAALKALPSPTPEGTP